MTFVELLEKLPNKVTDKWVKENLKIEKYLPVVDKYATAKILSKIILDLAENVNYNDSLETNYIYIKYDIYTTLTIFCKYINVNIEDIDKTSTNYDKVFSSGLFDCVMKYCQIDYDRSKEVVDRIVGIEDISIYRELGRIMNSDAYFERLKKSQKILNGISLKKYETLEKINEINNPLVIQIADMVRSASLEEAKKKQQEVDKNGEKK